MTLAEVIEGLRMNTSLHDRSNSSRPRTLIQMSAFGGTCSFRGNGFATYLVTMERSVRLGPNSHGLSPVGAKVVISVDSAFAGTPSRHSRTRVTPVAVRYGSLIRLFPFSSTAVLWFPCLK